MTHALPARRRLLAALSVLALTGCAGLAGREPLRVSVAGIEPLAGEGLEMRFLARLRVQNPNDAPVAFDGIALDLDLNGNAFAAGVSNQAGEVPRFGETVIEVPLTVSALDVVRQALAMARQQPGAGLPYVVRGRLAGGPFGTTRFTDRGNLTLPTGGNSWFGLGGQG